MHVALVTSNQMFVSFEYMQSPIQLSESKRLLTQFLLMETSLVPRQPAELGQELPFPFCRSRFNISFFM